MATPPAPGERARRISWGQSHVREHAVETFEEDGTYHKTLAWDTVGEYVTVSASARWPRDERARKGGKGNG